MRTVMKIATGVMGGKKTPWYLAGGIPLANCVGAYQAIGASSYTESKVNLASPGTHNLIDTNHAPSWDTATGWTGEAGKYLITDIVPQKGWTTVARIKNYVTGHISGTRSFNAFWQGFGCGLETTPIRFYNSLDGTSKEFAQPSNDFTVILSGRKCYIDGVYKNIITDSTFTITLPVWLLGHNREGNPALLDPLNGILSAWAIYDFEVDDPVALSIHEAMVSLPT